jgi:hypothetical protein
MENAGRPVEMTFTNESSRVLWVNNRARVNSALLAGYVEVQLTIRGASGEVPYYCKDQASHPGSGDYALLRPGETLTVKADTLWCYLDVFSKPGTYTAAAVYHDRTPDPPQSPPGVERLTEEVVADPVQFRVVAR